MWLGKLFFCLLTEVLLEVLGLDFPKRISDKNMCTPTVDKHLGKSCAYQLGSQEPSTCNLKRSNTADCGGRPDYTGEPCTRSDCALRLAYYRNIFPDNYSFSQTGLNLTFDVNLEHKNEIHARYRIPAFQYTYCLDFSTLPSKTLNNLATLWYDCHVYDHTYQNRTAVLEFTYNTFVGNYSFVVPPEPRDLNLTGYVNFFYLHLHRLPQPIITLQLAPPELNVSRYVIVVSRDSNCSDVLSEMSWNSPIFAFDLSKDTLVDIDLSLDLPRGTYSICVRFDHEDCPTAGCYTSQLIFSIEGSYFVLFLTAGITIVLLLIIASVGGVYYYLSKKQEQKAIHRGTVLLVHKSSGSPLDRESVDDLISYLLKKRIQTVLVDYKDIPRSTSRDPYTWHAQWVLDADVIVIYFPPNPNLDQVSKIALQPKDDHWNIYHNSFELALGVLGSNALDTKQEGNLTVLQKSVVLVGQVASSTLLPTEVKPLPRFDQTTQLKAFTRHIRRLINQSSPLRRPPHADYPTETGCLLLPDFTKSLDDHGQGNLAILQIPQPPPTNIDELGAFPPSLKQVAL